MPNIVTVTGTRLAIRIDPAPGKSYDILEVDGPHTVLSGRAGVVIDLVGQPPQVFSVAIRGYARNDQDGRGELTGSLTLSISAQAPPSENDELRFALS